jgi:hypothetical protein
MNSILSSLSIGSASLAGRQNLDCFRPKAAISLHRCAMIEKVFSDEKNNFFDTISDFANFVPTKELVYKHTQN